MVIAINEEVLAHLIKRGIDIETILADVLFQLLIVEEDDNRRRKIYELLRDTECDIVTLIRCFRIFSSDILQIPVGREHKFEEMFTTQRISILKNYVKIIRDFYKYLIEDIRQALEENVIDKSKVEKTLPHLERLLERKENQLTLIEKLLKGSQLR